MAWTTPKEFVSGERLFASDLNTYVSDNLADLDPRTVKSFADASARTTAIPSPAAGAVTFLEDTDAVEVYDGSAWVGVAPTQAGVLQVVYASTDTTTSTTSTTRQNTSLTGTITPADTSNQVLVVAYFSEVASTNTGTTAVVDIYNGTSDSTVDIERVDTGTNYGMSITYLDSPASASAVTYTARIRRVDASATVSVSGWQTLVLMEVAA